MADRTGAPRPVPLSAELGAAYREWWAAGDPNVGFARWLTAHDAEVRAQTIADLRAKFGPTNRAADYLSRKEHDRG